MLPVGVFNFVLEIKSDIRVSTTKWLLAQLGADAHYSHPTVCGDILGPCVLGERRGHRSTRARAQACRNFVQLALEGYYDRTTFHRVGSS